MTDILFDVVARDLILTDNDFTVTDQAQTSVQNAGIILESRVSNLLQPQVGIGFNSQVMGGDVAQASAQLSRCVSQILADGALQANWVSIPPPPNTQFDFSLSANYAD
jgi:hypothetical protein